MKRAAFVFGVAALAVNMPRLVLAYLGADRLAVPAVAEATLLTVTAIGTALVLTGGGLFIVHTLAGGRYGGGVKALLVAVWFFLLGALAVLLTPALLASMRQQTLPETLGVYQALWTVTAIVAPEVLAGGIMIAWALTERPAETASRRRAGRLGRLLDAATARAVSALEAEPGTGEALVIESHPVQGVGFPYPIDAAREQGERRRALSKAEALDALVTIWSADPSISIAEAGRRIGRARQTVSAYVSELEASGRVTRNGQGVEVLDA